LDTLTVKNISFHGAVVPKVNYPTFETLTNFSHEFIFGRSYLLAGEGGQGGWALSWVIGGLLKPDSGETLRNGLTYERNDRQKDVWCVRYTEIKRFGIFRNMSLKAQIRYGLRTGRSQYLKSEQEIIDGFDLSEGRYNRLLRQFSYEGWRASCAAGLANGKQIFCFPRIHNDSRFYEESYASHLRETIALLRTSGALVIVPADLIPYTENLCDEIVNMT
jgi:ABC-type Na+ transport system ATPase subunit NatA